MNRAALLAFTATALAGVTAKFGFVDPPVNLQASSPGVQQVGSINVSGKILSGSMSASNASAGAQVIVGDATGGGFNFGGLFKSSSPNGTGVRGVASSTSGVANGGTFQTFSSEGAGILSVATATSGANFGGFFRSASTSGEAVHGEATATSGVNFGGVFSSASLNGAGVSVSNLAGGVGLRTESTGRALDVVGGSAFTGTAVFNASPAFAVTSSTLITGLNSDLLDGISSSAFGQLATTQTWTAKNTFAGNTGFGGAPSATRKMKVTGDAEITDDLKVGSLTLPATTREYTVGAFDCYNADVPNPNQPVLSSKATATSYFAPVHLPQGAVVTKIEGDVFDTNTGSNATVFLIRRTDTTGEQGGTMAQYSSAGDNGHHVYTDTTISSPQVDNVNFIYFVRFDLPSESLAVRIASVHITYTVSEPLP